MAKASMFLGQNIVQSLQASLSNLSLNQKQINRYQQFILTEA